MKDKILFTDKLWQSAEKDIEKIISHPFCVELSKGILSKEKFNEYISQDSIYIIEDSRALAITAVKAEDVDEMKFLLDMARDGLEIEHLLHEEFIGYFNIVLNKKASKINKAYTNFLLSTAKSQTYEESLAALLPCFWVYREVGLSIVKNSKKNNKYQKWIDTYSGDEFEIYNQKLIDIVNKNAELATEELKKNMLEAFKKSVIFEFEFFDSAYNLKD